MATEQKKGKRKQTADDIWRSWQEELKDWQTSDRDQRDQANESDFFTLDKDGQWEDKVARRYESQDRPRYTFDKLTPLMESMMADIERMDFGGNVKPADGAATKEIALIYDGMIRSIQNSSNTNEMYRHACRRNMRRGFDAWIVKAKELSDWSFDQDLVVESIPNAVNRVWNSNTSTDPTGRDTNASYVLTSLSPEAYREQYPNGSGISVDDNVDDVTWDSYQPEVITIAERYYPKESPVTIAQLTNGDVIELDESWEAVKDEYAAQGVVIAEVNGRPLIKEIKQVWWFYTVFDGGGILEPEKRTVFTSNPIVTIYGNFEISGHSSKRSFSGVVLKQMDTQRVHNYAKSKDVEEGVLSPRAKVWMTTKQAKGHDESLQSMNISADPVQFYNPDPNAPPPFYAGGAQANPHLTQLGLQSAEDMKEQVGVFSALQGQFAARQSEESVKMQIDRGTASTRKWVNALVSGIQRTCELLIQAIPVVYDTRRKVEITGIDGASSLVTVNDEVYDQQTGQMIKVNTLNKGRYKVTVDAGPAFANKMEEGLAALLEYAKVDPTVVQMGGDLMVKAIDAPLVDQVAERKRDQMLRAGLIPPEQMTDEEKQKAAMIAENASQQPDPAVILAQAEMMSAQNDRIRLELEAEKLRQSGAKVEIDAAKTAAGIRSDEIGNQIDAFKATTDRLNTQIDAEEADVKIKTEEIEQFGKKLDNTEKLNRNLVS